MMASTQSGFCVRHGPGCDGVHDWCQRGLPHTADECGDECKEFVGAGTFRIDMRARAKHLCPLLYRWWDLVLWVITRCKLGTGGQGDGKMEA